MTAAPARRLILTPGDPAGIGPEVVLRALPDLVGVENITILLAGPPRLWETAAERLALPDPAARGVSCLPAPESVGDDTCAVGSLLFSGTGSAESAAVAMAALEEAATAALASPGDTAIVTGPVSKRALHCLGITAPGQTEWFADRCGGVTPLMLLVGGRLRVALITTHLPVREVAAGLTISGVHEKLRILDRGLRLRFGVPEPRIALLALNPHGGSGGEEGEEERLILHPARDAAVAEGMAVEGPFSADAFFGRRSWRAYDAVLAPYHDQGLIPVKTEAAGAGVNTTLGLPIVRTSPDHGTAFDIAGRGLADARATVAAGRLAAALLVGEGAGTPGDPA